MEHEIPNNMIKQYFPKHSNSKQEKLSLTCWQSAYKNLDSHLDLKLSSYHHVFYDGHQIIDRIKKNLECYRPYYYDSILIENEPIYHKSIKIGW